MSKGTIDAWCRKLDGDRLEIFFRVANVPGQQDRKIRASGPVGEMNELADWFEEKTGMKVNAPWRVVTRSQIPGQLGFAVELTMGELESEEQVGDLLTPKL